jgi:bromodomain-containing factor 1
MADVDVHSPATTPGAVPPASSNGASTSHTSPADPPATDLEDDKPPPAKRPRILSDADKASFTHVSLVFLCAP